MFRNEFDRGRKFKECAARIAGVPVTENRGSE